jgi:hypothetical protein
LERYGHISGNNAYRFISIELWHHRTVCCRNSTVREVGVGRVKHGYGPSSVDLGINGNYT